MLKLLRWLVLIGSVLAVSPPTIHAQDIVWTDSARLALAQCFVGEAGWRNRTEHAVIAHVLLKRWRYVVARNSSWTFDTMVRRYCAVHRVRQPNARHRWVRRLPLGPLVSDPGFGDDPGSRNSDWHNFVDAWAYTLETQALFEAGNLSDPMPEATCWGSDEDGAPVGGVLLDRAIPSIVEDGVQVALLNLYYRIDSAVVRRRIRWQRMMREDPGRPYPVEQLRRRGV